MMINFWLRRVGRIGGRREGLVGSRRRGRGGLQENKVAAR